MSKLWTPPASAAAKPPSPGTQLLMQSMFNALVGQRRAPVEEPLTRSASAVRRRKRRAVREARRRNRR